MLRIYLGGALSCTVVTYIACYGSHVVRIILEGGDQASLSCFRCII